MLVFLGISYHYLRATKRYLNKPKYLLLASFPITALMTVLGASSRGAQLGFAIQAARALLTRKNIVRTLVMAAVVVPCSYAILPEEQKARFAEAGTDQTSQQRLLYWKNGWEMMLKHPTFGVGYFNFIAYYENYYPQDLLRGRGSGEYPHNIFVQVGSETGFTGLLVYLMIIIRGFSATAAVRKSEARNGRLDSFEYTISKGLDLALWGFIVAGQFVSVAYYPYLWIHMAMVVCLHRITVKKPLIARRSLAIPPWRALGTAK